MKLAQGRVGLGRGVLGGWRSQFDFDAPGLSARDRLERLQYAVAQAARGCTDEVSQQELECTLAECRELLQMESLDAEAAEASRVRQRVERVRRVALHYEGQLARLNRLYWWIPCSVGLLVLTCCFVQYVLAL